MNFKHKNKPMKWIAIAGFALLLIVLVWPNHEALWRFIYFICDHNAIGDFIEKIGIIGPLALMGLIGLQVLIPYLPSEPPIIAGGYAYGFIGGFLMSWLVMVAATQVVFYLARYGGRPLVERFVPDKLLDKWTRIASERGTMFFLLAFIIPPVPSDIMIYVAGLSAINGRRFFVANFFGRMPIVAIVTFVGSNGFSNMPAMILGLTSFGVFMLIAWCYFILRERPEAVIRSSKQSNTEHFCSFRRSSFGTENMSPNDHNVPESCSVYLHKPCGYDAGAS
jgi:uncharacterized membrane protein YdjX (TVP38/TMEM64 family)